MVVFGGEGRDCDNSSSTGCPTVYMLDMPNLAWRCIGTTTEAADACPGACVLHISTVSFILPRC